MKEVVRPLAMEAELEAARAEAVRLRGELATANVKLHAVSPEYMAVAKGAAFASADDKYMHLLESMHAYEKEVQQVRKENDEMWESQRLLREENAELHVSVKKAMGMAMAMQAGTTMLATTPAATTVTHTGLECHCPGKQALPDSRAMPTVTGRRHRPLGRRHRSMPMAAVGIAPSA